MTRNLPSQTTFFLSLLRSYRSYPSAIAELPNEPVATYQVENTRVKRFELDPTGRLAILRFEQVEAESSDIRKYPLP